MIKNINIWWYNCTIRLGHYKNQYLFYTNLQPSTVWHFGDVECLLLLSSPSARCQLALLLLFASFYGAVLARGLVETPLLSYSSCSSVVCHAILCQTSPRHCGAAYRSLVLVEYFVQSLLFLKKGLGEMIFGNIDYGGKMELGEMRFKNMTTWMRYYWILDWIKYILFFKIFKIKMRFVSHPTSTYVGLFQVLHLFKPLHYLQLKALLLQMTATTSPYSTTIGPVAFLLVPCLLKAFQSLSTCSCTTFRCASHLLLSFSPSCKLRLQDVPLLSSPHMGAPVNLY